VASADGGMGSGSALGVKSGVAVGASAHAFSGEFETVGVVDQAIEDGVCEGRVADDFMPGVDGELAGDDGRLPAVAVLEDLEQVAAFDGCERGEAPVVEDQQVHAGERLEHPCVAAVAAGDGELLEEARDAVVEDVAAVATGLVADGAGDPAFTEAGGAGDQQVLRAIDPCAVGEMGDDGAVETARRAQIEVLDAGGLAERCELQAGDEAAGVAFGGFAVDEEAEALLEGQAIGGG